jgi:hypothetical protein
MSSPEEYVDEKQPRQIVLSTNDPTENEENICAVLTESVLIADPTTKRIPTTESATAVSKVSFYLPVLDLQDYIDRRYTASISDDGSKIILRVPSCPNYMKNAMGRVCRIFHQEVQEAEMIAHGTVAATAFSRLTRAIEITLDGGETFNNYYFNDGMPGDELFIDSKPLPIDSKSKCGRTMSNLLCLASFSVAINGTEKQVRLEAKRYDGPSLHDRAVDGYFTQNSSNGKGY